MYKRIKYLIYFILLVFIFSDIVYAQGVWLEGNVTKTPYKINNKTFIHLNGDRLIILPDTPVNQRYEIKKGMSTEIPKTLNYITYGQRIMVKVHKNKINNIILF